MTLFVISLKKSSQLYRTRLHPQRQPMKLGICWKNHNLMVLSAIWADWNPVGRPSSAVILTPEGQNRGTLTWKGGSWKTPNHRSNVCLLSTPLASSQAFTPLPLWSKHQANSESRAGMSHTWLLGCVSVTPPPRKSPDLCGETINTAGKWGLETVIDEKLEVIPLRRGTER